MVLNDGFRYTTHLMHSINRARAEFLSLEGKNGHINELCDAAKVLRFVERFAPATTSHQDIQSVPEPTE